MSRPWLWAALVSLACFATGAITVVSGSVVLGLSTCAFALLGVGFALWLDQDDQRGEP